MSLKEAADPLTFRAVESLPADIEPNKGFSSIASICKNFAYERPSSKDRITRKPEKEEKVAKDIESRLDISVSKKEIDEEESQKEDKFYSSSVTSTNERRVTSKRQTFTDDENNTLLEIDPALSKVKTVKEDTAKKKKDRFAIDLDAPDEDFQSAPSKRRMVDNQIRGDCSLKMKDKRKLIESRSSRNVRHSKRRKRAAEDEIKQIKGVVSDDDKGTGKCTSKESISIDNYDEVCLDGIK